MPITYQKLSSNSGGVSIDLIFPIGSVITNSSPTFDPNKLYEGTTWQRIKGRVIVGVDENDTSFNTINKTGGHKELQSHTHNGSTNTAGSHYHSGETDKGERHYHSVPIKNNEIASSATASHGLSDRSNASFAGDVAVVGYGTNWDTGTDVDYYSDKSGHTHGLSSMSNGGSHSHTVTIKSSGSGNGGNLPPYITKYVWERTA